jgi:addiction module HigA family antidote
MTETQGIRLKSPVHPGAFIRQEIFAAQGLSISEAAKALGVARPALSALLNERVGLSPEMAMRVEKAFGVSPDTLMRMQGSFDARHGEKGASDL